MNDLISRKALKEELLRLSFTPAIVMSAIDRMPAVDAVPVVHGRWITVSGLNQCSNCGTEFVHDSFAYCPYCDSNFKYCPVCGAKMDGGGAR